jgi:hypothetical protein
MGTRDTQDIRGEEMKQNANMLSFLAGKVKLPLIACLLILLCAVPCQAQYTDICDSIWGGSIQVWRCQDNTEWVHEDSLVCPIIPGSYNLEIKIDTAWVKFGKEKATGLILYEAKPDTLWRWVKR